MREPARLYLMRHGETYLNRENRVQGRCDSPLTDLGIQQAHVAARWFVDRQVAPRRLISSPLGRARQTLELLRQDLIGVGVRPAEVEIADGLTERCYGSYEMGPRSDIPADLWEPGDALTEFGGESEKHARERIVGTLTDIMESTSEGGVLAMSHGAITLSFLKEWSHTARCPQDVYLDNCCILVFEFDRATRSFANTEIINHDFARL